MFEPGPELSELLERAVIALESISASVNDQQNSVCIVTHETTCGSDIWGPVQQSHRDSARVARKMMRVRGRKVQAAVGTSGVLQEGRIPPWICFMVVGSGTDVSSQTFAVVKGKILWIFGVGVLVLAIVSALRVYVR